MRQSSLVDVMPFSQLFWADSNFNIFGNSSIADFFEVHNNISRLASLFVSCLVHYSLSFCLATFAILLCYKSILTVQMVLNVLGVSVEFFCGHLLNF